MLNNHVVLACSARENKENLDDLAIQSVFVGSDGACFWWTRILWLGSSRFEVD